MPAKRVILELGTGNDLHGGDYTKAALRAVQDALHHSSLTMLRTLGVNSKTGMFVDVTIGVQQPAKVDLEKVRSVAAARHRDGEGGQGRARRARSRGQRYRGDRQCRGLRPAGASVMLLYEHPLSSYAQKVKIALREKGLDFKVETPPALGSGKADGVFAAASLRNEVPALIDGDAQIFDSTIILEYLEDKFPSPPLLPRDPAARAQARMIEDVCDTLYEAVNWGLSEIRWFKRAEGEQAEKMKATAARQTAELQAWLTGKLGKAEWFNGASFGWADLSVAPYVNRSFHYGLGTPSEFAAGEMARPHSPASLGGRDLPRVRGGVRAHGRCRRAPGIRGDPARVSRSPAGMDDEVRRRAGRARRPGQEQHPLHLAAWLEDRGIRPCAAATIASSSRMSAACRATRC